MPYDLDEDEIGRLMQAVAVVLNPWMGDRESSVIFEGEPMAITMRDIRDEAPGEIKALDSAYMAIIARAVNAVDPDESGLRATGFERAQGSVIRSRGSS